MFNKTILPNVDQKNMAGICEVFIITIATVKTKQSTSVRIDHTIRVVNFPLKIKVYKKIIKHINICFLIHKND